MRTRQMIASALYSIMLVGLPAGIDALAGAGPSNEPTIAILSACRRRQADQSCNSATNLTAPH